MAVARTPSSGLPRKGPPGGRPVIPRPGLPRKGPIPPGGGRLQPIPGRKYPTGPVQPGRSPYAVPAMPNRLSSRSLTPQLLQKMAQRRLAGR